MTTARISAANMAAKLGRAKQACAEYKALLAGSDLSYAQRVGAAFVARSSISTSSSPRTTVHGTKAADLKN